MTLKPDADVGPPKASVIIVAYNSAAHLQRVVDALSNQSFDDFDVIIWDNASTDNACEVLRLPERARVIRSSENLGFAGGNNAAAKLTDAPLLVLLNPDAFPEPDWLERLVLACERRPKAGMIGSLQLDDADPERLDGLGDVFHVAGIPYRGGCGAPAPAQVEPGDVFGPCAAAALYRREAFDAVGGFDERYFCYVEDVDLAFRIRLAGWTCFFESRAVVRHVGSATVGRRSDFAVYHGTRNRIWTIAKDVPVALLPILIPMHVAALTVLLIGGLLRRSGVARATLRGVRDGVFGVRHFLKSRRAIQKGRSVSTSEIAAAMTWSPLKLARRAPDIRPER